MRFRYLRRVGPGLIAVCLWGTVGLAVAHGQEPTGPDKPKPPGKTAEEVVPPQRQLQLEASLPKAPPSILPPLMKPVDLGSSLRLAGFQNPQILIARQRIVEAQAFRLLAAAKALPNLNVGLNIDTHQGVLQQSNGNILKVNRGAMYLGLGANAVAAGTVGIPGLQYNMNLSEALFGWRAVGFVVAERQFDSLAVRNAMLLEVATAYVELLRAEGLRWVAIRNRDDAYAVALQTAIAADAGLGARPPDAYRAATELAHRNDLVLAAEGMMLTASARLAQLLNLDPSTPLAVVDGWVVPAPLVPDPAPLAMLLTIALNQRPEMASRRAAIQEAMAVLQGAKWLPFSPTLLAGFSTGTFGGGSNLVSQPGGFAGFQEGRFDSFSPRDDVDIVLYWTAQNFGVGNIARIRLANTNLRIQDLELLLTLNRVRAEVATAYARTHARYNQIAIAERAVAAGQASYEGDRIRVKGLQGLPIELLDSFRLLASAREQYLNAVMDYNRAQFELYVALGQPPAETLARAMPSKLVPPPARAAGGPGCPAPVPTPGVPAELPATTLGMPREVPKKSRP